MTKRLQTPVDVISEIREDMAKFQRISRDKQELKMTVREVLRDALLRAFWRCGAPPTPTRIRLSSTLSSKGSIPNPRPRPKPRQQAKGVWS
jgi:hypothetical protein